MRIRFSRKAELDLDEIWTYVHKDNERAAREVIERILAAVDQLIEFPAMGRIGRVKGTRELVIHGTPFVVAYRIDGDDVGVARIMHGAQRWPRQL